MVAHIVFWNLKEEALGASKEENMKKIAEGLQALVGVVPGLLSARVGINFGEGGYDLCLVTSLLSKKALEGYQNHPAHVQMKEFIHQVITDRAYVDYEI